MDCENFQFITQGAEAKLFKGEYLGKPVIVKERFVKKYRHPILDDHLLKERMKAEAKGLLRAKIAGVNSPAVYLADIDSRKLYIEYIDGLTVKNYIDKLLTEGGVEDNNELKTVTDGIGSSIGKLHRDNLIHGDLTTSNMLVDNKLNLYMIDFGLSCVSSSAEDKGVDLYVLERALKNTHSYADEIFQSIISAYSRSYDSGSREVMKKYKEIQARGRKRTMVG